MRAKFTNESVESILKPVSGDEIRNKFKECILKIYPDFNERAQKLLDVLMTDNFYAPIMKDLNVNLGGYEGEDEEDDYDQPQVSSRDKKENQLFEVINAFSQLMEKLELWNKSIKVAQETIEGYIEGMKALSSYKSWQPGTTYYKGWF